MEIDGTQIAIAAVGLVFTAVIVPLVKVAFAWLKGKTQNEALKSAIDEARAVADSVVAGLQANVVEGLKAKSADGKLSVDETKELAEKAATMFLSDLSSRSLAVIKQNADDINAFIGNLVESRLLRLKKGGN
ncbi:MAG: hypothetical protein ACOX8Q_10215 [Christensenellales bacterium]|jgi:hypothetical protein